MTESNQSRREIVARNITAARETAKLSKRRLAMRAGVDRRQLLEWESGEHEPTAGNLIKLAPVLGQSLEWFYVNHDGDPPDDDDR